ncbi:MAG TPA: ORF6N domain-containing protein [Dissulfurispiraceae bacterium]|nr:ORF6N domain-containing protein [Dissulfurispiraceae bacterium]
MKDSLVPHEVIETKILVIRGRKVMLDRDLAALYGVETKALNQAIKRNQERFPDDFMFQLSMDEFESLRSQFVTSKRGGQRYIPYVFTENGVAMLSSVLNSDRAIQVNIQIMRTFSRLREMLATHKDLQRKIEDMEQKYDERFTVIFDAIKRLLHEPEKQKKRVGFLREKERH